jgi:hypothetical protein
MLHEFSHSLSEGPCNIKLFLLQPYVVVMEHMKRVCRLASCKLPQHKDFPCMENVGSSIHSACQLRRVQIKHGKYVAGQPGKLYGQHFESREQGICPTCHGGLYYLFGLSVIYVPGHSSAKTLAIAINKQYCIVSHTTPFIVDPLGFLYFGVPS